MKPTTTAFVLRRSELQGQLSLGIEPARKIEDAFAGASLVVIQNNHEFFARMPLGELSQRMAKPGLIYDYWCQFDGTAPALANGIEYLGFGNATSS